MEKQRKVGLIYGIIAYSLWGFLPIYWKSVKHVDSTEVICNRIFWSVVFLALLVSFNSGWKQVRQIVSNPKSLLFLVLTSLLIGANWLLFILAVNSGHVLDGSLGYFISPLLSIVLAVIIFKERLKKAQIAAVILVFIGVCLMTSQLGHLPVYALSLALTFSSYALLRKKIKIDPIHGMFVETIILLPLAIVYMFNRYDQHLLSFEYNQLGTSILLIMAGAVTSIPLLCFVKAAQNLEFSTLGLLQYISPTLQFFLAVFIYNEEFSSLKLLAFSLIWLALAIYSYSTFRKAPEKT